MPKRITPGADRRVVSDHNLDMRQDSWAEFRDAAGARRLTEADDLLHPPADDSPYWRETAWWSVTLPSERMGMWIYANFFKNLGTSSIGIWLWDSASHAEHELVYATHRWNLPLPDGDLDDLLIGDGCHIRTIEPFRHHRITFEDPGLMTFDLRTEALMPPQAVSVSDTTGHIDQPLWFTGEVRVGDRQLLVDGPGIRDRSWLVRTPSGGRSAFYVYGASRALSFHAIGFLGDDGQVWMAGGFIAEDGTISRVVEARRTVEERGDGPPIRVRLELVDDTDNVIDVVGEAVCAAGLPAVPPYFTWVSTMRWTIDGRAVWGEDNEAWTNRDLARRRAQTRPAEIFMRP